MDLLSVFAENLKYYRHQKGYSQEELGGLVFVSSGSYIASRYGSIPIRR